MAHGSLTLGRQSQRGYASLRERIRREEIEKSLLQQQRLRRWAKGASDWHHCKFLTAKSGRMVGEFSVAMSLARGRKGPNTRRIIEPAVFEIARPENHPLDAAIPNAHTSRTPMSDIEMGSSLVLLAKLELPA